MLETKLQETNNNQSLVYIPSTIRKLLGWAKGDRLLIEVDTKTDQVILQRIK